jgi:hypothetical protein
VAKMSHLSVAIYSLHYAQFLCVSTTESLAVLGAVLLSFVMAEDIRLVNIHLPPSLGPQTLVGAAVVNLLDFGVWWSKMWPPEASAGGLNPTEDRPRRPPTRQKGPPGQNSAARFGLSKKVLLFSKISCLVV